MNYTDHDYITNAEYDEALRLYHNGLDYTKAIKAPKQKRSWYNPVVAESMMIEGEEFEQITGIPGKRIDHIIITNLGRIINTNTGNTAAVWITKHNIIVNMAGTTYSLNSLLEDTPWDYDYDLIIKNYIENKWRIKKHSQYTKSLGEK